MAALKEGSEERPLRSPSTDQACLFDPLVAFQVVAPEPASKTQVKLASPGLPHLELKTWNF